MKWAPLVIAAFTFLSSTSWAYPHGGAEDSTPPYHGMRHQERRGILYGDAERLKKTLGLDNGQISRIRIINGDYGRELKKFRSRLRPKKTRLREMLILDRIDYNALKQLLHEISDIETELRFLRIKHRFDIEAILTPVQKKQLSDERHRKRRSVRHGR